MIAIYSFFLLIFYNDLTILDGAAKNKPPIRVQEVVVKKNSTTNNSSPYSHTDMGRNDRSDLKAHLEYLDFGIKFQSFFDEYNALKPADRKLISDKLRERIRYYESKNYMSLAEAYYMELNLIEATSDNYSLDSYASDLQVTYNKLSAERKRAFRSLDEMKYKKYKAQEGKIVASIGDMEVFPHGMDSQEYLEWKLDQARQEIYSNE